MDSGKIASIQKNLQGTKKAELVVNKDTASLVEEREEVISGLNELKAQQQQLSQMQQSKLSSPNSSSSIDLRNPNNISSEKKCC